MEQNYQIVQVRVRWGWPILRILPDGVWQASWRCGKAGDHFPQTCPHPLLSSLFHSVIFFPPFKSKNCCPLLPSWFACPISHLPSHFALSPHSSLFTLVPPLPSWNFFLLIQTSLALCWSNVRSEPMQCWPPPIPQPPHSLKGESSDRALPYDYTGGAGLEYSPEGRQLSISDNCQERHTHTCRLAAFLPLLLLR